MASITDFGGIIDQAEQAAANPTAEPPHSQLGDVAKSVGSGLRTGLEGIPGLPGDVAGLGRAGIAKLARALGYQEAGDTIQHGDIPYLPDVSSENIHALTTPILGESYQPQTRAGRIARSVADFLPGMFVGGPTSLARKVAAAGAGGTASELAGEATEGTALEPWARAAGGIAGGSLTEGLATGAQNVRTRGARRAEAAVEDEALQHGVRLTKGQRSGNVADQMAEQKMLGGARGDRAQRLLQERTDANRQALDDSATAIRDSTAPTRGATPAESGAALNWSTRRRVERLKREGGEKIEEALQSGTMIDADRLRSLPGDLARRLEGDVPYVPDVILDSTTPVASQAMSRVEKFVSQAKDPAIKEISLAGAEQLRRQLIGLSADSGTDRRALGKVIEYFDDWLEDVAGNQTTLKEGRRLYREGKQVEEPKGRPPGGKAVAGIAKGQQAEDTARLFTPNDRGELSASAIDAIDRLRATGSTSGDLDQVRGIILERLTTGDPGKVATRVENFIRNNPTVAQALFSSDALDRLASWGQTNRRTVPQRAATNPSNSAMHLLADRANEARSRAAQSGGMMGLLAGGGPIGGIVGAGLGLATDLYRSHKGSQAARRALEPADRSTLADAMSEGGRRGARGATVGALSAARIDDPGSETDGQRIEIISEGKDGYRVRMPDGSERVIGKNLVKPTRE